MLTQFHSGTLMHDSTKHETSTLLRKRWTWTEKPFTGSPVDLSIGLSKLQITECWSILGLLLLSPPSPSLNSQSTYGKIIGKDWKKKNSVEK